MTIENRLLEKLADWRPDGTSNRLTVDDSASGWRATVQADAVDTIGVRVREVGVARLTPLTNPTPLADRAAQVADRVNGLLEPLRVVETDQTQGVAQLRSDAPAVKGDTRSYYELTVHDHGAAKVERFASTAGGKRQQVPFSLTHEGLGKLVGDLSAD